MGRRLWTIGLVVVATACGLDAVGVALTGGAAGPETGGPSDGAAVDGGAPEDAGTDAPLATDACGAVVVNSSGQLAARRAGFAVNVNGDLGEWSCVPFVRVDQDSGVARYPGAVTIAAEIATLWDDAGLYVAARVLDPAVQGNDATEIFYNDSIELYLDGDGNLTGAFGADDHQYVIDHANRRRDYGPQPSVNPPGGELTSAARLIDGGYVVEARISAGALGKSAFAAGNQVGFTFGATNGNGNAQQQLLYWYRNPGTTTCSCAGCCCTNDGNDWPHCNTHRFGRITLGN